MTDSRRTWRKALVWVVLVVVAGGAYYFWHRWSAADAAPRYATQPVSRGDITQTVTANGTLNPVVLVNVGTQVSGTVKKLFADFNDHVTQGQVLAELDPSLFRAQVEQDRAKLEGDQANLRLAEVNERRNRILYAHNYIPRATLDQSRQALEAARAQVAADRAQLAHDQINLNYTVIRSPVAGVVVSRNVNVGQTVAASFQTPTLFQIAQDLRHMQIDTTVSEADIGNVRSGQPVTFTVDAFPGKTFHGAVSQIRLNPTIQQNVVTYDAVVAVNNPQAILLPGMTAFVNIITARRNGVLRIPNAALRFRPTEPGAAPAAPLGPPDAQRVYRLEGRRLVPVTVRTGISDNKYTELLGGDLKIDAPLVVEDLSGIGKQGNKFKFRFF